MFSLTFAQMRRSIGRLTAAGIAIAIGTAFVAATLLASDVLTRATYDSVAAQYGSSDLVVRSEGSYFGESRISAQQLDQIRQTDGVAAADPVSAAYLELTASGSTLYQATIAVGTSPELQPLTVAEGALPASDSEIALPEGTARLLGVSVGDTVDALSSPSTGESVSDPVAVRTSLTVTGIVDDPYKAYAAQGGAAVVTEGLFTERHSYGYDPVYPQVAVALTPGTDVETARERISAIVDPETTEVVTKDEAAAASVDSATGGQQVFTVVILAFAAIAMVVAALVISNTFQVLVAQRTRTLALLRCVGAKKAQLRGSVVLEAATLGLVSSLVGLVLGSAFVQLTIMVLARTDLDFPIPGRITFSLGAILWPLVVGTLVTVVASLVPARAATRVAPLEAMRPADAPTLGASGGKVRLAFSLLLAVGGALVMALGVYLGATTGRVEEAVAAGVFGGAVSFVGILVGAVFWLPRVIGLVGRLLGSAGPSARLAGANITRNPRRTAATSSALLIGVTLVAMMSVGAASARASLASTLDSSYNVDVMAETGAVEADGTSPEGSLTPAVLSELASVDGVADVAPVSDVMLDVAGSTGSTAEQEIVSVVSKASAQAALRDPSILDGLDATHAVVSPFYASYMVGDDRTLTLTGPDGSVTLDVVVADLKTSRVVVDATAVSGIVGDVPPTTAWIQVTDLDDASTTVNMVRDALSSDAVSVTGAAVERATMQQAIDTMLAVVVGLLAIAVVIALIGVANTLSLSVLERRRESATLRAIGLSKRQLRLTLAVEGSLIAGVGAVLGIVLGTVYGWVGALVVLGGFADVSLSVPVVPLVLVLVVSVAAGLLASVVPGRTAARTSPVEALAVD